MNSTTSGTQSNRPTLWLVRHGETEWSRSGQYTGLTDIPLLPEGEEQARAAGATLAAAGVDFALTLSSPLQRAWRTAELAGFADVERVPQAHEWDYGEHEGVPSQDIRAQNPDYRIWDHGVPGGEELAQVAARADSIIERVRTELADHEHAILFSHGHFSRVMVARWLGLPPETGRHFLLGTAKAARLGWDKTTPAVLSWGV